MRRLHPSQVLHSHAVVLARADAPCPWCRGGAGPIRAPSTGPTDRRTEGHTDRGLAMSSRAFHPDDAPLPWGADGVFGVPIDHALGGREAVPGLPWPAAIGHWGTTKVYPVIHTTRPEMVGGDRAHLDELFPWGELAGGLLGLHGGQHGQIGGRGQGGRHLGDQVRRLVVTGCGDRSLVAGPCRLTLCARAGFGVRG
jgi:hypothetical protein